LRIPRLPEKGIEFEYDRFKASPALRADWETDGMFARCLADALVLVFLRLLGGVRLARGTNSVITGQKVEPLNLSTNRNRMNLVLSAVSALDHPMAGE